MSKTKLPLGLDLNGEVISNVGTPVATTDAANKDYVDTGVGSKADTDLGNLAATAINEDLVFVKINPIVKSKDNTASQPLDIKSGDASAGDSGNINIITGTASGTRGFLIAEANRIDLNSESLIYISPSTSVDIIDYNGNISIPLNFWSAVGSEVAIKAPSNVPVAYTMTLPTAQGGTDSVLANNGSGLLSWAARAKSDLSNLTTTAINEDLIFDRGAATTIRTQTETGVVSDTLTIKTGDTSSAATGLLTVKSGDTTHTSAGGQVRITSGTNAGTGATGKVTVETASKSTSGSSGGLDLLTGSTTSSTSGLVQISSGISSSGASGNVTVGTGTGGTSSGSVTVSTSNSPATGAVNIRSGVASTTSSGAMTLNSGNATGAGSSSGNVSVYSGEVANNASGTTGSITLNSGNTIGTSGSVIIASGTTTGTVSGDVEIKSGLASTTGITGDILIHTGTSGANSGNISIYTGTATSVRGNISLDSESTDIGVVTAVYISDVATTTARALRFYEDAHTDYIGLKAPASVTTSVDLVLPNGAGSANQMLVTDGAGNLSWSNQGVIEPVTTYTSGPQTLDATQKHIICDGTFTINLPAAASSTGKIYNIKNKGSGTVTIDANSAETIDGAATLNLTVQYESYTIICDGTEWFII